MTESENITLKEAISDFYRENEPIFVEREISDSAKEFFRCHDIAHVVFACDTSIFGEGIVKIWTIFGSSLGFWKHLNGYSEANAFSLFSEYSWSNFRKSSKGLFIALPKAIRHAKNMSKCWPWSDHEEYLDITLYEIRKEFNIKVVRRNA